MSTAVPMPGGPGQPGLDEPVFVISVAAYLAGLHPQTLRQYDKLGLVTPDRTAGRNRMYSLRDIERLREVSRLGEEGVNLEGIRRILELEEEVRMLRERIDSLTAHTNSRALVLYRGRRRNR